jgi:hypothetical protein
MSLFSPWWEEDEGLTVGACSQAHATARSFVANHREPHPPGLRRACRAAEHRPGCRVPYPRASPLPSCRWSPARHPGNVRRRGRLDSRMQSSPIRSLFGRAHVEGEKQESWSPAASTALPLHARCPVLPACRHAVRV